MYRKLPMRCAAPPLFGGPGAPASDPCPAQAAGQGRRVLLVGNIPHSPIAWWLNPVLALCSIVIPIFCYAASLNRFNFWTFGSSEDFVTRETFFLGLYSAGMLAFGMVLGRMALQRQDMVTLIDVDRTTRVLARLGWVTVLAYSLLLGTLLVHIDLVLALLRGNLGAASELRLVLGRIPGVTSLTQFGVIYLALLSALVTLAKYRMPTKVRYLSIAVLVLTVARAVLASERLAMLEAFAAMFVTPVAYKWRPSPWRAMAPFIGIVGVFIAFAAGEYFRSWQYYQMFYSSYFDFITQRFAGYFSTSINNGSGAYLLFGKYSPEPQITVQWIAKFPVIKNLFPTTNEFLVDHYLRLFANPEFNNPGGFYAAFLDFSFFWASLFMVGIGFVTGLLYRAFVNKNLVGLMLYPVVFLGVTDFIRVVYISDVRTLPIFLGAFVAYWGLRPLQVPRDRLARRAA